MDGTRIIRYGWIALFILVAVWVRVKWYSKGWVENPIYPFIAIFALGGTAAILFVIYVLPMLGDAAGEALYSSGERVKPSEGLKAAAKIAAGDYEGAIQEYEKHLEEKPDDAFAVSEVAKLRHDKLGQPEQALAFLQEKLEGREWTQDDAAFLMFRIADIHTERKSYEDAKSVLEQVVGAFPGSRHSANARHKINELEQLEYKELQSLRAKTA